MSNVIPIEALRIMDERFGFDNLISIATCEGDIPHVRTVNAYYEGGAFYIVTNAESNKMRQISQNPVVGICGEWFTGHGIGESLGWVCDPKNHDIADRLRTVFAEWYGNGHVNEDDVKTIILRVRLTDGVLFNHGTRYDLKFS